MKQAVVINDYSAFGSNSLAVALPVLGALSVKAHALPTAVLSAQTGFEGYTMHPLPLAPTLAGLSALLKEEPAYYSGFFANAEQIQELTAYFAEHAPAFYLLDPVMGDNGALYPCYDQTFVERLRGLLPFATVITPNLTEACLLAGEDHSRILSAVSVSGAAAVLPLAEKLQELCPTVVVTGIPHGEKVETLLCHADGHTVTATDKQPARSGTGDLFASLLFGLLLREKPLGYSVKRASLLTAEALKRTEEKDARYGTDFEKILSKLR